MTINSTRPAFSLATAIACLTLSASAYAQSADPLIAEGSIDPTLALHPSTPNSCSEFLARKFAHLNSYSRALRVTMATNQVSARPGVNSLVSYGELWLQGPARPGLQCSATGCEWVRSAQGNGIQLFNDRRPRFDQPFDAARPDRLSVRLDNTGRMVLVLDSWPFGNKPNERHIAFECRNEVMFGFDEMGVMYIVTLTEDEIPG